MATAQSVVEVIRDALSEVTAVALVYAASIPRLTWRIVTFAVLLSVSALIAAPLDPWGLSATIALAGGSALFMARREVRRPEAPEGQGGGSDRPGAGMSSDEDRLLLTAGITHELRTPLTILKGRLHGIEDGVILADHDETATLLRQVDHVLEIVNDLDLLAKADLGRLALRCEQINPADVARAVALDLRPLFACHDMQIVEEYDDILMMADPVRLTQILTNLVTNAAKHSSPGGTIMIEVEATDDAVRLRVFDEGPGFAPADRERLFTPFWRSSATMKRAGCPGTGMGLALTARLVEAHGGRIGAENRTDRSGACFEVVLPVKA